MLWPADNAIVCKNAPTADQIKNVLTFYSVDWSPKYSMTYIFDNPRRPQERLWFLWHHLQTENPPRSGGTDLMRVIGEKFPHLVPQGSSATSKGQKVNLLHPDVPKIFYDQWVTDGKPKIVKILELDGTGFPYADEFPMPEGLNRYEQETFKGTISSGTPIRHQYVKGKFQGGCKTYEDGEKSCITEYYAKNLRTWLTFYVANEGGREKIVLTPLYLKAYKNIEKYFIEQGATNTRFLIYAYSAYYYIPPGENIPDLKNFEVEYVSPLAQAWNREYMEKDIENFRRWQSSGAEIIWRPNLWYNRPLEPYFLFALHNEFVYREKPDGIMLTGYTPGSVPGVQGVNFYTMFRVMQGTTPEQALEDYITAFHPNNQPIVRAYIQKAEEITLNREQFDEAKVAELKAILQGASAENDGMMAYFKKGIEIAEKRNQYTNNELSRAEIRTWFLEQLKTYPGLGLEQRFMNSVDKLKFDDTPPEY